MIWGHVGCVADRDPAGERVAGEEEREAERDQHQLGREVEHRDEDPVAVEGGAPYEPDRRDANDHGDPDDDVLGSDHGRLLRAELGVVLGVLDGLEQRLGSPGVVGDEEPVRGVEGRHQLGRVDHRQPPGGAGAEVVDGPPGTDALDREVHRDGKLWQDLQHRRSDAGVLVVERLKQLQRAHGVQSMGARVAFLRGRADGGLGLRWPRCVDHTCDVTY